MNPNLRVNAGLLRLIAALAGAGAIALAGCGGGAAEDAAAAPSAPAQATLALAEPAPTMTWNTAQALDLEVALQGPAAETLAGAAVRLFRIADKSPQDGSTLDQPVPAAQIDEALSGADGRVRLTSRLPAHIDHVLIVATHRDLQASMAVSTAAREATVVLQR